MTVANTSIEGCVSVLYRTVSKSKTVDPPSTAKYGLLVSSWRVGLWITAGSGSGHPHPFVVANTSIEGCVSSSDLIRHFVRGSR